MEGKNKSFLFSLILLRLFSIGFVVFVCFEIIISTCVHTIHVFRWLMNNAFNTVCMIILDKVNGLWQQTERFNTILTSINLKRHENILKMTVCTLWNNGYLFVTYLIIYSSLLVLKPEYSEIDQYHGCWCLGHLRVNHQPCYWIGIKTDPWFHHGNDPTISGISTLQNGKE